MPCLIVDRVLRNPQIDCSHRFRLRKEQERIRNRVEDEEECYRDLN